MDLFPHSRTDAARHTPSAVARARGDHIDLRPSGIHHSRRPRDRRDDWHVFSSLNFADDHPARDMRDTFFINRNPDVLLRTHTSSVQSRVMEHSEPDPHHLPGRVYRNEAISARAHCFFHQVEALYVDRHVTFADLRQTLLYFAREMFGNDTRIRLRPSYFPFTEPSAEMDIFLQPLWRQGMLFLQKAPDGWRYLAAAWWIPTYSTPAASIPRNIADSLSAWV